MLDVFYFKSLRIITVQFADLFNNIKLRKFDGDGNVRETNTVPISYAPKQAYIARLTNNNTIDDDTDTQLSLPRISFELNDMQPAPDRQTNPMNLIDDDSSGNPETRSRQYAPVPYDINMLLSVHAKRIVDSYQIIEQILPYFRPDFNLQIEEVPEMGIVTDVPVILNSVQPEDNYQQGFTDSRLITWNLDFTIRGHIYPPVHDEPTIQQVTTNYRDYDTDAILESLQDNTL